MAPTTTGGRLTRRSPKLAEIIDRRGINRIAYFHCDHFEPWRGPISQTVDESGEEIMRFAEASAANPFSNRLTLFYKAHIGFARTGRAPRGISALPGDPIIFLARPPNVENSCRNAMSGLLGRVGHEIQIHVHHENYTYNTAHADSDLAETLNLPGGRDRDAARFEFALRLALQTTRRETGLSLKHWFFVHGQWGLNASDPSVCHITNEIEILQRNGALGDFTFPAGRPNVDPFAEEPHFVKPVDAPAGYRTVQAEAESAFGNATASETKFFIWASPIRHRGVSLDYYSDHVIQDLSDPEGFASRVLENSYLADGTLYFKTHAHSMHPNYRRAGETTVFPHQHSGVSRMLGLLFDAASAAGAAVDFVTASEIYHEFTIPRPRPGGFALNPQPGNALPNIN